MNENVIRHIPVIPVLGLALLLGLSVVLRAGDQPAEPVDHDTSPYHVALLDYKSGKYDEARTAIGAAEKANPGDPSTEILKTRILTELGEFAEAEQSIKPLTGESAPSDVLLALGDLYLRKRSFDKADKIYERLLATKPDDPDLTLKDIYSRIGASDLVAAAKLASLLKPFDPTKDPFDPRHPGNPSYYFAKAALAQATGKIQEADEDIETARTLFGTTTTHPYLKTYLQFFNSPDKNATPASRAEPPSTNAAPAHP